MLSRRQFGGLIAAGWSEMALAQLATVNAPAPAGTVWLNANENPAGPPRSSIEAMSRVIADSGRYHYQEFHNIYARVAQSEQLEPDQVLVGAGSTEILHCAIDVFTSPVRPLIIASPSYEMPSRLTEALGRRVVAVPLTKTWANDVRGMAEAAGKAGGGLIYLCNPNNPTASITSKSDVKWLVDNLPADTVLLVDEAYIHFATTPEIETAMPYVRQGKNVIVARTFSKIYGMAGLRIGFGCARPDFIKRMSPFRDNVVNIVGARAVVAALAEGPDLVDQRRAANARIRTDLCGWLRQKNIGYIEPHANFLMIDARRDVRPMITAMMQHGVAVGRRFPDVPNYMRVTIGTAEEMEKFREALVKVI